MGKWRKSPTWKQLRKARQKFNVPTTYFFLTKPLSIDKLPAQLIIENQIYSIYEEKSLALIDNIRKSEIRRTIFIELHEELNEPVIKFEIVKLALNKKIFSNYIREILYVPLETQKSGYK